MRMCLAEHFGYVCRFWVLKSMLFFEYLKNTRIKIRKIS